MAKKKAAEAGTEVLFLLCERKRRIDKTIVTDEIAISPKNYRDIVNEPTYMAEMEDAQIKAPRIALKILKEFKSLEEMREYFNQ
jgi:hypothetical protein